MKFEYMIGALVIMAVAVGFLAMAFVLHWRNKVEDLSDQLSRSIVRAGNLEEECQRLAWCAFNTLKSLKKDLESRSVYFERQRLETPHKDHEQRAIGYREASATMGEMIQKMEARADKQQKIKVDCIT